MTFYLEVGVIAGWAWFWLGYWAGRMERDHHRRSYHSLVWDNNQEWDARMSLMLGLFGFIANFLVYGTLKGEPIEPPPTKASWFD